MNTFKICLYASAGLFAVFVIYNLLMRIYDRYLDRIDPLPDAGKKRTLWDRQFYRRPRSYFRIIFENALRILLGISFVVLGIVFLRYDRYGAFLDDSWKYPDVEEHFLFEIKDGEYLEDLYHRNEEAFDLSSHNVVLVKLGCKRCENLYEEIMDLRSQGYLILFSRSDIGRLYVEEYGIASVPCLINGNTVTYLDGSVPLSEYN